MMYLKLENKLRCTGEKITGADKNLPHVHRTIAQSITKFCPHKPTKILFPNVTYCLLFRLYFITSCFPFIICPIFTKAEFPDFLMPDLKITGGPPSYAYVFHCFYITTHSVIHYCRNRIFYKKKNPKFKHSDLSQD